MDIDWITPVAEATAKKGIAKQLFKKKFSLSTSKELFLF